MKQHKRIFYTVVVCVLTALCLSACSNEDEPTYWDCLVADSNGEQIWDRYVSSETTEIQGTITSNYAWMISSTSKIRVTPSSGKVGVTPITISFEANKSTKQREIYFTLRPQSTSYTVREDRIAIIQKGVLHILTNPNTLTLGKDYGKAEVTITSNIEDHFQVETPGWINAKYLRRESDDDGDIFTYYYQLLYNDNFGELRTGNVVFTSPEYGLTNYIHIIQNGAKGTPYK